ncbi:MAG: HlyD family efflux transporter periplasmic adaptor subunit [Planctomycetota bacterium]
MALTNDTSRTDATEQVQRSGASSGGAPEQQDVFVRLTRLAAESSDRVALLRAGFRAAAESCAAVYARFALLDAVAPIEDQYHPIGVDPNFWDEKVRDALDVATSTARSAATVYGKEGGQRVAILSAPLTSSTVDTPAALALAAPVDDDNHAYQLLAQLRGIAGLLPTLAEQVDRRIAFQRHIEKAAAGAQQGEILDALAVGASSETVTELAFSITNNLRAKLGCDQVALAATKGRKLKLVSISGFADVTPRSPGAMAIRAAAEEAADLCEPIIVQSGYQNQHARHRLNEAWHREADGAAVVTIPLEAGGKVAAVLALRHRPGERWEPEQVEKISQVVRPYASALTLVERANTSLLSHAAWSTKRNITGLFKGRGLVKLTALACLLTFSIWFFFGTMTYTVSAVATVEPGRTHQLTAPFNGRVLEVKVRAGSVVEAGDVLAVLDDLPLRAEQARLEAEVQVQRYAAARAEAEGDMGAAQTAKAEARVFAAELALANDRLANAVVRAPAAGVVTEGDLEKLIGQQVSLGTPLLELARWDEMEFDIAVPDSASAAVEDGFTGVIALEARPDDPQAFTVKRVAPSGEVRDGKVVFMVTATPESPEAWVRPGMHGTAKVDAGERRVCWVATHDIIDWLRLKFLL